MKQVVYLHGLNSSHRSFSYIEKVLPEHTAFKLNYASYQPLQLSINQVIKQLPDTPFVLVGHSLGGVIATIIAAEKPQLVSSLITIASPHGGSKACRALRWLPGGFQVLNDLIPSSQLITRCCRLKLEVPTLNIVTTGGSLPTSPEPNDSVVAVSSQRALRFGKHLSINANHFEVLQHEQAVEAISSFIFGDNN